MIHPFGSKYCVEGFDFLVDPTLYYSKEIPMKGDTCLMKINTIPINATINANTFEGLLKDSVVSKVGINKETVENTEYRKSHEISQKEITSTEIDKEFMKLLQQKLNEVNQKYLLHPTSLKIEFYKLVLYEKEDFFLPHFDADHSEGDQVMTISVDLYCGKRIGGILLFQDLNEGNNGPTAPSKDNITMSIFYNDVGHSVSKLDKGRKVSLVFNVLQTNELDDAMIEKFDKQTRKGFRSIGSEKIGVEMVHIYMSKNPKLKGVDRIIEELFKINKIKTQFIKTATIKGFSNMVAHEDVFKVFHSNDEYTDKETLETIIEGEGFLTKEDFLKEIEKKRVCYEKGDEPIYNIISKKFKLGHIHFLWTNAARFRFYEIVKDDLYLGNEGMICEPITSLAIIEK
jgi:hypothetical protein